MSTVPDTQQRQSDVIRQAVNVLAFVGMVAVNVLANALPLNGQTTAEISNRFPVFFVPAGYVFSIWGVIYLALAAFVVYQALPGQRSNPVLRERVGYLFALSCVINTAWLFLWHWNLFLLTEVAMVALLINLIAIYIRVGIGRTQVPAAIRWLVQVPFSIYLGWITVATIANTTDVLHYVGWDGWGIAPEMWGAIMLVVATLVASVVIVMRRDAAYAAVIVWAFVGILVKQSDTPLVATTAGVMAGAVALVLVAALLLGRPSGLRLASRSTA